jgi:hypothetical protein
LLFRYTLLHVIFFIFPHVRTLASISRCSKLAGEREPIPLAAMLYSRGALPTSTMFVRAWHGSCLIVVLAVTVVAWEGSRTREHHGVIASRHYQVCRPNQRDMSSQICLKWNSFLSNIATSFESLWEEEGLVDVTLASDGQCLTAHKVILSASSPFFKKVFQVSPSRLIRRRIREKSHSEKLIACPMPVLASSLYACCHASTRAFDNNMFDSCHVVSKCPRVEVRDDYFDHL